MKRAEQVSFAILALATILINIWTANATYNVNRRERVRERESVEVEDDLEIDAQPIDTRNRTRLSGGDRLLAHPWLQPRDSDGPIHTALKNMVGRVVRGGQIGDYGGGDNSLHTRFRDMVSQVLGGGSVGRGRFERAYGLDSGGGQFQGGRLNEMMQRAMSVNVPLFYDMSKNGSSLGINVLSGLVKIERGGEAERNGLAGNRPLSVRIFGIPVYERGTRIRPTSGGGGDQEPPLDDLPPEVDAGPASDDP